MKRHCATQAQRRGLTFLSMFIILKRILGILLLIIGIVALVTPLTPGAWLIFVGLELLGLGFLIPSGLRKYWVRVKSRMWRIGGGDANT